MTANHLIDARRPERVMADIPREGAGVGRALRDMFCVSDELPSDMAQALNRLHDFR